jgi:hypothetical protein
LVEGYDDGKEYKQNKERDDDLDDLLGMRLVALWVINWHNRTYEFSKYQGGIITIMFEMFVKVFTKKFL